MGLIVCSLTEMVEQRMRFPTGGRVAGDLQLPFDFVEPKNSSKAQSVACSVLQGWSKRAVDFRLFCSVLVHISCCNETWCFVFLCVLRQLTGCFPDICMSTWESRSYPFIQFTCSTHRHTHSPAPSVEGCVCVCVRMMSHLGGTHAPTVCPSKRETCLFVVRYIAPKGIAINNIIFLYFFRPFIVITFILIMTI